MTAGGRTVALMPRTPAPAELHLKRPARERLADGVKYAFGWAGIYLILAPLAFLAVALVLAIVFGGLGHLNDLGIDLRRD